MERCVWGWSGVECGRVLGVVEVGGWVMVGWGQSRGRKLCYLGLRRFDEGVGGGVGVGVCVEVECCVTLACVCFRREWYLAMGGGVTWKLFFLQCHCSAFKKKQNVLFFVSQKCRLGPT